MILFVDVVTLKLGASRHGPGVARSMSATIPYQTKRPPRASSWGSLFAGVGGGGLGPGASQAPAGEMVIRAVQFEYGIRLPETGALVDEPLEWSVRS